MITANSIRSIRAYFRQNLSVEYTDNEIDRFFFMALQFVLSLGRLDYHKNPEFKISESEFLRFRGMVKALKQHTPIQYLIGETSFLDLRIKVNPSVLIPRPETEEMVQDVFNRVSLPPNNIMDACTGSGCIALALKRKFPKAHVMALDYSGQALQTARENSRINQLDVMFVNDDLLFLENEYPEFDLIVSNPPYVTQKDKEQMKANVLNYEPPEALFVPDEDPLKFYDKLIELTVDNLSAYGWFFYEINEKFGKEVFDLCMDAGLSLNTQINNDLNRKARWVCGQKNDHD